MLRIEQDVIGLGRLVRGGVRTEIDRDCWGRTITMLDCQDHVSLAGESGAVLRVGVARTGETVREDDQRVLLALHGGSDRAVGVDWHLLDQPMKLQARAYLHSANDNPHNGNYGVSALQDLARIRWDSHSHPSPFFPRNLA